MCTNDDSELDNHMEEMLGTYLDVNGSDIIPNISKNLKPVSQHVAADDNALKSCLLVFYEDVDECEKVKELIEQSQGIFSQYPNLACRIVNVYRLYFMRLAPILIRLMNKLCFRKTQLCDILLETTFKKTNLARVFVPNEHLLCKYIKCEMIQRILIVSNYSSTGRLYAAALLLDVIRPLNTNFVLDHCDTSRSFLDLVDQFIREPSVVIYLVENDFLCQMIDFFSDLLKMQGLEARVDVMRLFKKAKTKRRELSHVLEIRKSLCSCLRVSLNDVIVSSNLRSRLCGAGRRMGKFCFDFDNMQPIHKITDEEICKECPKYLKSLFGAIFLVLSQLVKWIIGFEEIAVKTL
ncbi:hypothetical protein RF11_04053 [Thelohanellus kitauei]|uniref:Uncharacterized protein n=1 Tax=Thelohanellus kitauei TaxID=669202 RepID=A0A0C2NC08_THEKT|nr:hypothetical protein RF11_04053 [Thelohanellus kitauei]